MDQVDSEDYVRLCRRREIFGIRKDINKNMDEEVPGHFQSKSITLGPDIKGEITLEINYQRSIRCCMKAT